MDRHDVLRIRIETLIGAALAVLFLLGTLVLVDASPLILLLVVLVGLVVAAIALLAARLVRRQPPRPGRSFFLRSAALAVPLVTAAVAAPVYVLALQPALNPLLVPRATLTNGTREVVFQGMVHIGSDLFYRSVTYDILRARDAGYVIYYEGINPGTPEAEKWFREALSGGGDINANYAAMSDVCGLHFQGDYLDFAQADEATHPERSVAADVTSTEMQEEWQRLVAADPTLASVAPVEATPTEAPAEAPAEGGNGTQSSGMTRLLGLVSLLDDRQRGLLGTVCRGLFTYALQRPEHPGPLDAVVLDFRNRKLAERILADPAARIYVVYGSGHLPGLLADLQAADPDWTVEGASWTTAITPPDEATGSL